MADSSDVSVVIVNWNTRELLGDCLRSIVTGTSRGITVYVVDNGSADGSVSMVRQKFPDVRIIQNSRNVGFAAANNQVIRNCLSRYILLLNSDTRVQSGAIDYLVDFMDGHSQVGAIGPKIIHPSGRLRVLSCGSFPSARTLFCQYFFLASLFPNLGLFQGVNLRIGVHDDRPRRVEWLSGACLLVRREVVAQVGPLSEQWFMYAEDLEWCWRIGRAGWDLVHVPEVVVEHYVGASAAAARSVGTLWVSNMRDFYIHRCSPSRCRLLAFDVVLVSGLAFRACTYWLLGLVTGDKRAIWQLEARRFCAYCQAAYRAATQHGTDE